MSSDAKVPKLNKLGGTEWAKTKRKVTAKIEDIADELINYTKRDAEKDMRLAAIQWNNKNSNKPSHIRKRKTNCEVLRKLRKICKRTNRWTVFLLGTLDTGENGSSHACSLQRRSWMESKQLFSANNDSCRATLREFRTTLFGLSILPSDY